MNLRSAIMSAALLAVACALTSCAGSQAGATATAAKAGRPTTMMQTKPDAEGAAILKASGDPLEVLDNDLRLAGQIEERAYAPGHGGYPEYLTSLQRAFDQGRFKICNGANVRLGNRTDYVGHGGPRYAGGALPPRGLPTTGRAGFESALREKMASGELKMESATITYPDGTKRTIRP